MSLPTESRPIRMDPDLSKRVDKILSQYSGKDLEKAQEAVRKVYTSGYAGSFGDLVERYRTAAEDAVQED